ncbi:MAG: hypothetical protein HY924_10195 [Elusimicrobia bacterium]|nr:hypothetical protein [Elusimicrobiota bacterium]
MTAPETGLPADSSGARLVSSGAFRVDRGRALDKLMRFQLPEAGMFVLPLLRCAVASGASRVRITTLKLGSLASRFVARFDGRPFTPAELQDPYSILFNKRTPETARNRELAVALLTALRIKQGVLSVTSGSGTARVRLDVRSLREETVRTVTEEAADTAFELTRGELVGPFDDVVAIVRRSCAACRISVLVDGVEAARIPALDPETSLYFEDGGVRGWLTVPRSLEDSSVLRAFTHGVEAGPFSYQLPVAQVEGLVNDDRFALSVSQTGVAATGRFKTAMGVVERQTERLIEKVIAGSEARLAKAGLLVVKKGPAAWIAGLDRGRAFSERPGLAALMGRAVRWLSEAGDRELQALGKLGWTTGWLLDACERSLSDPARDAKSPALKALWDAPLLLGSKVEALSMRDLAAMRSRLGFVPYSTRLDPGAPVPFPVVWSSGERAGRLLRKLFADALKDVTVPSGGSIAAKLEAAVTAQADARVLHLMGLGELLIRESLVCDGFSVEVAIPGSPSADGAQVYLWEEAGPRRLDMSPRLKFAAAILGASGSVSDAVLGKLVAAASACAEGLYRRLAHEYDCWKTDARNAAIRRGLLELLAASACEPGGAGLGESKGWLAGLSLFRTDSGWTDYRRLKAAFDEGKLLAAASSLQAAGTMRREPVFLGPEYQRSLLEDLLPGAAFLAVEGFKPVARLEDAFLFFKKTSPVACGHKSHLGCLAVVSGLDVHLTVGGSEEGRALSLPWGTVAALGGDAGLADLAARLASRLDLAAAMAAAIVETHGTAWRCPEHNARRFLLKAVPRVLAPWPGHPGEGAVSRLQDLLASLAFFQSSSQVGLTLEHLGSLFASSDRVTYALRGAGASDLYADLLLDGAELDAVRRLFPNRSEKLFDIGVLVEPEPAPVEPVRSVAGPALSPEPVVLKVPATDGIRVEARAPAAPAAWLARTSLQAPSPMLFERRYEAPGARALIGLSERWKEGLELILRKGQGEPDMTISPKGLPLVGTAVLDLSASPDPGAVPSEEVVLGLFLRFYSDLLDAWPLGGPGDVRHRTGVRYLLKVLELHDYPANNPGGAWDALLSRMLSLRMLPALGMELVSLSTLAVKARERGFLPFAAKPFYLRKPEDSWVPVLGKPEQGAVSRLVCGKLGVKLRPYKPEPEAAEPPAEEFAAVAQAEAPEPPALAVLRRVLKRVRGRRGVKILPAKPVWRDEGGAQLVLLDEHERLGISTRHLMARAVADSGLDEARQGYYLASLVFTSVNRMLGDITDLDDVRFHESLAELLASPAGRAPGGG